MWKHGTSPSGRAHWPFVLAGVLALLLSLPAFEIGFFLDDYYLLALLEDWYDIEKPPVNLYTSFMAAPNIPWWHSPDTQISFWRPLSSALLRLDHALFGRAAAGWQAHGLLWLAAFLAVIGALFRRLPRRFAVLAFFLLALDEAHAMTSGVIANRHAVIAATLAFFGLLAHRRWREDGWRPGLPLSLVAYTAGLLAGETALAVLAYVLAFECLAEGSVRERLRAVSPVAGLAMLYVLVYKALDYGPRGSSFYLDPLGHPGDYLIGLLSHIPALLAGGLTAFPAQLWGLPEYRAPLVAVGSLASLALATGLVWQARRVASAELRTATNRTLMTWGLGALLSLLPVASAPPSERQLLVPVVGLSVVLGAVLVAAGRRVRAGGPPTTRVAAGMLVTFLAVAHLMVAPLGRVMQLRGLGQLDAALDEVVAELPSPDHGTIRRDVVLINVPDFFLMLYVPLMWEFEHDPGGISWNLLSGSPHDLRLSRVDAHTLAAESVGGAFLTGELEELLRPKHEEAAEGQVFTGPAFRAEVLATAAGGPSRLGFRFERQLDDARLDFFVWQDGRLKAVAPPGEGQILVVPAAPGILGLL